MKRTIYEYRRASRYLRDRVLERKKTDHRFSLRRWSEEIGFRSPSLLSMVLQGKRNITLRQVPMLARGLGLSTAERMFFQGLVQIENAKTREEREWCELWVSELRPKTTSKAVIREIDEYAAIANWIHPALLALSDTESSFVDAAEASRKLGYTEKSAEVESAIERLKELELLRTDEYGRHRATCIRMTSRDDVANRGAREYHRQSALLAAVRVEAQDVLEREFQSMAIAIPSGKIPLAKELIRKFRTQFSKAMASEHCDSVYQWNLHFFRLSTRTEDAR